MKYRKWENFHKVIKQAIVSCETSNYNVLDHFTEVGKMVKTGDSYRKIDDYKLSRYACYLIVQNSDSRKEVVALGQTYFAIQTRKQELRERDYESLTEDEKRFYQRNLTKKGNYSLNQTARRLVLKILISFIMHDIEVYITERALMILLKEKD